MADEKWKHKDLPRANGIIAPAVYNTKDEEWQALKSDNGNFPTTDILAIKGLGKIKNVIEDQAEKVRKSRPVDGNGDSLFTNDHKGKVQDKDVKERLEKIEEQNKKMLKRMDETFDTQLTGSNMEYYGKTKDDRPEITSVEIGDIYMAVKTQEIWQSDGSSWVVM